MQEQTVDRAEDDRVGSDPERQRQPGHAGQAGSFHQGPQAIPHVVKKPLHGEPPAKHRSTATDYDVPTKCNDSAVIIRPSTERALPGPMPRGRNPMKPLSSRPIPAPFL